MEQSLFAVALRWRSAGQCTLLCAQGGETRHRPCHSAVHCWHMKRQPFLVSVVVMVIAAITVAIAIAISIAVYVVIAIAFFVSHHRYHCHCHWPLPLPLLLTITVTASITIAIVIVIAVGHCHHCVRIFLQGYLYAVTQNLLTRRIFFLIPWKVFGDLSPRDRTIFSLCWQLYSSKRPGYLHPLDLAMSFSNA